MKINELISRLPESMSGNISHSETAITVTLEKGYLKLDKSETGWGDSELTLDGKELTLETLKERLGKIELREYIKPPEVEQEAGKENAELKTSISQLESRIRYLENKITVL